MIDRIRELNEVSDWERKIFDQIFENAFGNPIKLSAAPTASEPLLEDNTWGIYSNTLYLRNGGTILVFSPSSTITIS